MPIADEIDQLECSGVHCLRKEPDRPVPHYKLGATRMVARQNPSMDASVPRAPGAFASKWIQITYRYWPLISVNFGPPPRPGVGPHVDAAVTAGGNARSPKGAVVQAQFFLDRFPDCDAVTRAVTDHAHLGRTVVAEHSLCVVHRNPKQKKRSAALRLCDLCVGRVRFLNAKVAENPVTNSVIQKTEGIWRTLSTSICIICGQFERRRASMPKTARE